MLLKPRSMACLGLNLALCQVLIILASVLDFSSLTFMVLANCCVGIAFAETGLKAGTAFFAASCILGVFLSPNKLYMLTYAAIGAYISFKEWMEQRVLLNKPSALLWAVKLVFFNALYIPLLLLFPELIFGRQVSTLMLLAAWGGGQLLMVLCDFAYSYFMRYHWKRLRKLVMKE